MPKITPTDSFAKPQTTQARESLSIKAITNASPQNPTINAQSAPATTGPEAAALTAPPSEQPTNTEANQEAKPLSPQYAALARKEQAIRTREKDLQAKETAFKAQAADLEKAKQFEARLKESPLEVLNELGITYDQLVEQAVNQPNPELKSVQQELKAIKEAQARQSEEAKQREDSQRQAAIKQIEYDVQALVESDPNFVTVKESQSVSDVVELIVKTFDETGKLLTVEEAAEAIETELSEELERVSKFSKFKKLTPEAVEANKAQQPTQQPEIKTLTNSMSTNRKLTPRERAILRFEGKLK